MNCVYCGKKLETSDKRVHYCSEECRRQGYLKTLRKANVKRRETNAEYRKRTYENNLRRYYEKKKAQYEDIAKELMKSCGDMDAMVEVLERRCKLRH